MLRITFTELMVGAERQVLNENRRGKQARKTKHCARGKCNPVNSWLSNQQYFGLTIFSTVKMMKMFEYVFNQNQDIFVLGGWGRQRESEQISSQ